MSTTLVPRMSGGSDDEGAVFPSILSRRRVLLRESMLSPVAGAAPSKSAKSFMDEAMGGNNAQPKKRKLGVKKFPIGKLAKEVGVKKKKRGPFGEQYAPVKASKRTTESRRGNPFEEADEGGPGSGPRKGQGKGGEKKNLPFDSRTNHGYDSHKINPNGYTPFPEVGDEDDAANDARRKKAWSNFDDEHFRGDADSRRRWAQRDEDRERHGREAEESRFGAFKEHGVQGMKWGVRAHGGAIGEGNKDNTNSKGQRIWSVHDSKEEAVAKAGGLNRTLTQGEKKYYRMKFTVVPLSDKNIPEKFKSKAESSREADESPIEKGADHPVVGKLVIMHGEPHFMLKGKVYVIEGNDIIEDMDQESREAVIQACSSMSDHYGVGMAPKKAESRMGGLI